MDFYAENHTQVNKKLFYEAMAAAGDYHAQAWKGMGILGGLWVALLVFTMTQGFDIGMALMELAVIGAVGLWLLVIYPRSRYKKAFKALTERGGLTRTICFYEDYLEIKAGDSVVEIDYDQVRMVKKTRHLLVLTCWDKTGTFLSLNGFTEGDADSVKWQIEKVSKA